MPQLGHPKDLHPQTHTIPSRSHRHITQTFNSAYFSRAGCKFWRPNRTARSADWYQGTADAIRKQRTELETVAPRNFLILSGESPVPHGL